MEGSHDLLELVLTLLKVEVLLNLRVLTRERGVVLGRNKTSMWARMGEESNKYGR